MSDLTQEQTIDSVRTLLGLVKKLYGRDLPDDFDVKIKVRGRFFRRMDIQNVGEEKSIIERNVLIRK